jgi:histidinol-phosphate aminotransferase
VADDGAGRSGVLLDRNENAYGPCLAGNGEYELLFTNSYANPQKDTNDATIRFAKPLDLHRYPSNSMQQLKEKIAVSRGLSEGCASMVTLGVGSVDLIDLLIRLTCIPGKDAILVTPPTFPQYQMRAAVNDVETVKSNLQFVRNDFHLNVAEVRCVQSPRVFFICNNLYVDSRHPFQTCEH